jgi:hypothetical protein
MPYRLAGRSTEFCSCNTPCPCAFGQEPTGGTCRGIFCFEIKEGDLDGLDLSGTRAVFAATFDGPWTGGNFTAALILDENASQEQRDALTRIYSGELGGDAANLAQLVGEMKGIFTAPFDYTASNGGVAFTAGEIAAGEGETLKGLDGTAEIQVTNAHYPLPSVTAGRSTVVKVNVPGLEYEFDGSGFWTGPFELKG